MLKTLWLNCFSIEIIIFTQVTWTQFIEKFVVNGRKKEEKDQSNSSFITQLWKKKKKQKVILSCDTCRQIQFSR